MHKPKVNFKFCMGNIPAMIRATQSSLSEQRYKQLIAEVGKVDGYLDKKRVIFSFVEPVQ